MGFEPMQIALTDLETVALTTRPFLLAFDVNVEKI